MGYPTDNLKFKTLLLSLWILQNTGLPGDTRTKISFIIFNTTIYFYSLSEDVF